MMLLANDFFKDQLSTQHELYLYWGVAVLLSLLILLSFVSRVQRITSDDPVKFGVTQGTQKTSTVLMATNVTKLAKTYLFGEPKQKATPVKVGKFQLVGVFMANKRGLGMAVIRDQKGNESLYFEGDRAPGVGKIKEILADKIIFEEKRKLKSMALSVD